MSEETKTGRSAREPGVPVKISKPAQQAVRAHAVLYNESQAKFISRALKYFVDNNADDINARKQAFNRMVDATGSELDTDFSDGGD